MTDIETVEATMMHLYRMDPAFRCRVVNEIRTAQVDAARERVEKAKAAESKYLFDVASGWTDRDPEHRLRLATERARATEALLRAKCPDWDGEPRR